MLRILLPVCLNIVIFWQSDFLGISQWLHPQKWEIVAFFTSISLLNYTLTERGFEANRQKFVQFFMASTFIRFILSLLLLGYVVYQRAEGTALILANFFVLYLFYTFFEIFGLYRKLQRFL